MATYRRPGTYVEETPLAQSVASQNLQSAYGAFVGQALRGPVDKPAFVASWSDFTRRFGQFRSANGAQTYRLAQALYAFFSNGGRGAWVQRVVGTGADTATVTFSDSAAVPALKVKAIDPGDWAVGQLFAQISSVNETGDGGVARAGDTFTLTIYSGGTTPGYVVESWTDLSLDPASARFAPDVLNTSSSWVTLERPAAASGTLPPVEGAVTALTNPDGVTGSIDGAKPGVNVYTEAVDAFDATPSNLLFNVPDAYDMSATDATNVVNAFQIKADARGDAFLVVDVPREVESTSAGALSWVNGINASGNVAAYFPSVLVPNPVSGSRGGLVTMPPGGAVLGVFHSTDASRGVFKTPAGVSATITNASDVSLRLASTQLDALNTAAKPVNVIRIIPGAGICIMGGRTLGGTRDLQHVGTRRTMLEIKKALTQLVEFAVFENNDAILRQRVATVCTSYLTQLYQAGGLKGGNAAQAFYVTCDSSNNTATDIENGLLTVEVGVALQVPTEFVVIRIGQFDGATSVSETL